MKDSPDTSCFKPSAAPAKMAANVTGALYANNEKADIPCPTLQPTAMIAPGPIIAAPSI